MSSFFAASNVTAAADPVKKQVITEFLNWMLTDGQKMTEALAYARLPPEMIAMEKKAIEQIQ